MWASRGVGRAVNQSEEHPLVYHELSRHVRPARVISAFEDTGRDWGHSALRMLENYSLTWGGARGLLIPVSNGGSVHEALWPLIEMFDADIWAVYNRTLRGCRLADPDRFESDLQGWVADWVERNGGTPEQARLMFTTDYQLDSVDGRLELSETLLDEIKRRTAPVMLRDQVDAYYFGADITPGYPLMNVCGLRPLPDHVTVLDTSGLPPALRVLIAMKCGGLGPRQLDQLEDADIAAEHVAVGPDDLDELLALSWRGKHDPPSVVLAKDAASASRFAANRTSDTHVYAMPSGLSLLGCEVLQRIGSWQFGTPLTVVVGSTADDFAYALALDRCGVPAWWVPDEASLGDDSISARMFDVLAWSIRMERQPLESSGQGKGVEVCSLSIPRDQLRAFCTRLREAGGGIWGLEVRDAESATVPAQRIELVTITHHANEPLDEPFRGERMLRPVPAALPTAVTSATPLTFSWWVDVEDRGRQLPNRTALHDLLLAEPAATRPLIRSGRDGISYHSLRGGVLLAGEPLRQLLARPRLRFPEAATVFRHLFEHAGYEIAESTTGRYRRLTTDLWGGFDELHKDWADDSTRALLKSWISHERSGVTPGIWNGYRRYLSLDDAVSASGIGADELRTLLDRYLRSGILSRGLSSAAPTV